MSDRYAAPGDVPERQIDPPAEWGLPEREWPGKPRAGGGEIVTRPSWMESAFPGDWRDVPIAGPTSEERKQALDDAWDDGFRCGTEVHRCKLRDARDLRDAKAAARAFHLQITLLVTIIVLITCVTALLVHG